MRLLLVALIALLLCTGAAPPNADAQSSKKTRITLAVDDSSYFPTDIQAYKVRGVCLSFTRIADSVGFVLVWYNGSDTIRTQIPLLDGLGNSVMWASGSGGLTKCYTMAFQFGDKIQAIRPDSARKVGRDTGTVVIQEFRPANVGALFRLPSIREVLPQLTPQQMAMLPKRTPLPDNGQPG